MSKFLKITHLLAVTLAMLWVSPISAQSDPEWLTINDADVKTRPAAKVGHEANAGYSYAADANMKQGNRSLGDLDAMNSYVNYTATFPVASAIHARVGFDWDRFSFGEPNASPLPGTLQKTALTLGFDAELGDKWIMRFEASPGIYSDFEDISGKDFNAPVILGFSYLVNSRLQWIFGLSADFRREFPVLPGVGVRWQFADEWTLNLIFPRPRIEYQIDPALTLFLGGELKGGTYAVAKDFGNSIGEGKLNNEIVEYTEARAGVGLKYQMHPAVALVAEAGGVFYRSFNFENENLRVHASEPAPFGAISLRASF